MKTHTRVPLALTCLAQLLLGAVALIPLPGCEVQCGVCQPAVGVRVTDAETGMVPFGTVVTYSSAAGSGTCSADNCSFGATPGNYDITVEADGYVTETVSVTVAPDDDDHDCSCGFLPTTVDVALTPEP